MPVLLTWELLRRRGGEAPPGFLPWEKGLSSRVTQVQVLVSPREDAVLLHQPPEVRCPTLCLSFGGTRETPSGVPRFPEWNELSGRRGTFPQFCHLSNCHPAWVPCTFHAVGWLRFCAHCVGCSLLGTRRRLQTRKLPQFNLCQRSILPPLAVCGQEIRVKVFLEKVRILPFSLLRLRVIPLKLVPLLIGPFCRLPSPALAG